MIHNESMRRRGGDADTRDGQRREDKRETLTSQVVGFQNTRVPARRQYPDHPPPGPGRTGTLGVYSIGAATPKGSSTLHVALLAPHRAEQAAQSWEHTGRIQESLEKSQESCWMPLGLLSDVGALLRDKGEEDGCVSDRSLEVLRKAIAAL